MSGKAGLGVVLLAFTCTTVVLGQSARARPAGPPPRWLCSYVFDQKDLPRGISLKQDPKHKTWWVGNTSDQPLVINAVYSDGKLAGGAKLVSGQVYFYFPNGIPMEGKEHLKGWQQISKEITTWSIANLPSASRASDGQDGKMTRATPIPPPERFVLKVEYDGRPHELKGTITYSFNDVYDVHYGLPVPRK